MRIVAIILLFVLNYSFGQKVHFDKDISGSFRTFVPNLPNNLPSSSLFWSDTTDLKYSLEKEKKIYKESSVIKNCKESIDSLRKNLESKDEKVKCHAIITIGGIKDTASKKQIEIILVNDTSILVKLSCINTLKIIGGVSSWDAIIKNINNKNMFLKRRAAFTLVALGEQKESFKILKKFWQMSDEYKTICHTGFRDIGTKEAIDFLRQVTTNKNLTIAFDALVALGQLGLFDECFGKIKNYLSFQDEDFAILAMYTLAYYFNDKRSYLLIKPMVENKNPKIQKYCELILKKYYKNKRYENN